MLIDPLLELKQSADMSEVAVVVQDEPPPGDDELGDGLGLGEGLPPVVSYAAT